jgi:ATP-dependent Clp protease ATP-binding subunit ClpA
VNAIKGQLADAQVFRPEILGRMDRVHLFDALQGAVMAEIALLKMVSLAQDYGLDLEHIAPEAIMDVLLKNQKVSRFGVRELERIIFDQFAQRFSELKREGKKQIKVTVDQKGQFNINP